MHLAIDTATSVAGVATITGAGEVEAELSWRAGRNHTAELFPAIEDILRRSRITRSDLSGVIVAVGPGSFTGVRIGMATAKGLAIGLGLPLAGVGTLSAAAYTFGWSGRTVWAVLDAGRGQVVGSAFRGSGTKGGMASDWRQVAEERVMTPEELIDAIGSRGETASVLCGEAPAAVREMVQAELQGAVTVLDPSSGSGRVRSLAFLGWNRLAAGDADDPMTVAPVYARPPAAVERLG